jgi:hypothetical protein
MSKIEKIIERNKYLQDIVNSALHSSLEPLTLDEHLDLFLELILTIPDMAFHAKGSIFLANPEGDTLFLAAHHDLPDELVERCAQVPFGYCLCGRAADMSEPLFSDCVDDRHDVRFDGMDEHGHYCLPIRSDERVLGVINLYVPEGHARTESEQGVLSALASILAGVIERKRGEDALWKVKRELTQVVGRQTKKEMFNDATLNQILRAFRAVNAETGHGAPKLEHLLAVLDATYYASMHRKEDLPIQVSVTLLHSRYELEGFVREGMHTLLLENTMPLRADSIVALAPSFNPTQTTLLVAPDHDVLDELDIIGALHFPEQGLHRFDANSFARPIDELLTVAVRDSGNLHIFRGSELLGQFSSGAFTVSTSTTFTESPLAWSLVKEIRAHPEFKSLDMLYWNIYQDLIDLLLLEISTGGHGGAIIWLPPHCREVAAGLMDFRFPLSEAPEGSSAIARFAQLESWLKENKGTHGRHARIDAFRTVKRELIDHVEMLAHLTYIDGALVLSDRLKPQTFGAMLHAKAWSGQIVSWENEPFFPSVHLNFKKLGARHASAVNFIGQCPGAVAFVVSQDGPVAGLTRKDENTIYWWPDCLGRLWDSED